MRFAPTLALGSILLAIAPLAQAQEAMPTPPPPASDAQLDARIGDWQGSGTMMGMATTDSVHQEWVLGHQFFQADSTTTVTLPDGEQMSMEMRLMYKPNGDGTYAGMYLASWGQTGEFTAHIEDGNMVMDWTDEDGASNRSVEVMNPDGTLSMTFSVQQADGTWAEMGAVRYTRTTP